MLNKNKIKVAIIGTQGIPAKYGGFETLVENLVKYKSDNIEYIVFCSAKLYIKGQKKYINTKLRYVYLNANGISSIFYDLICMLLSLRYDVMLILGVSGSLFLPFIRLLYHGKIITNIDGIEWKRGKWNRFTKYILRALEKYAIKFSDVVIGDNQGIVDYIKKKYKLDVVMIEYGADYVYEERIDLYEYDFLQKKYAFSVCRIEPENNIHIILKAFSCQTDISLVVIGNWKNSAYGLMLLEEYRGFSHIYLLDPIYDFEKINYFRLKAFIYVHGHSAGGTNPSLVEAMTYGLPVFAFDCIFNRYTTENQCIYWSDENELYGLIIQYKSEELDSIGKIMKSIAEKRYKWSIIISKYESLFIN